MSTTTILTEATIRDALRLVEDPEFSISVEDLGLIYALEIHGGDVHVTMTLTSMYCPAGDVILNGVGTAIEALPGVTSVGIDLVWTPTWTPERMTPAGRAQLGWDVPRIEE